MRRRDSLLLPHQARRARRRRRRRRRRGALAGRPRLLEPVLGVGGLPLPSLQLLLLPAPPRLLGILPREVPRRRRWRRRCRSGMVPQAEAAVVQEAPALAGAFTIGNPAGAGNAELVHLRNRRQVRAPGLGPGHRRRPSEGHRALASTQRRTECNCCQELVPICEVELPPQLTLDLAPAAVQLRVAVEQRVVALVERRILARPLRHQVRQPMRGCNHSAEEEPRLQPSSRLLQARRGCYHGTHARAECVSPAAGRAS
mmetsp:Transcript_17726/g.48591  ORF Transcript_17726/g.48591 Transcript_17726/m.48591 type:complete len:257 (-) Transcript_17726:8-778(-)